MGKSRVMPKAGYYRAKCTRESATCQEVMHVTGTKTGNEYKKLWADSEPDDSEAKFHRLLWTCVPNQKSLDEGYDYFETDPGFEFLDRR